MSWKILTYEEVSGFSTLPSSRRNAFLNKFERRTIFRTPVAMFFYIASRFSLFTMLAVTWLMHSHWAWPLAFVIVGILFISFLDREIYEYAKRRQDYFGDDHRLSVLVSSQADGWYDDPWANGIVGQQRYWTDGKWSKTIRENKPISA
jgi:hypothetical protein